MALENIECKNQVGICVLAMLSNVVAACGQGEAPTISPAFTRPTVTASPQEAQSSTRQAPTKTPVWDEDLLQQYGSLRYIAEGTLWEGLGHAGDRLIVGLPFEEIHAATLVDDELRVLADGHLASVDLDSGTVETRTHAELSIWAEELLVLQNKRRVVYTEVLNDDGNPLGHSTTVKLYDNYTDEKEMLTKLIGVAACSA